MNTKFVTKASTATFLYFKPKWEDTVNVKSSVEVIGLGYVDKATESNPSLVLITRDYAVFKEYFVDFVLRYCKIGNMRHCRMMGSVSDSKFTISCQLLDEQ